MLKMFSGKNKDQKKLTDKVTKVLSEPPCVRIVVASVFHKNITGSGKLDISEALS